MATSRAAGSGRHDPEQHRAREKLTRFGLSELLECCLIEGELGFGKPDRRIYELALSTLNVPASDAWMVGDNFETDLAEAKRMGMFAVWIDAQGTGSAERAHAFPIGSCRTFLSYSTGAGRRWRHANPELEHRWREIPWTALRADAESHAV
jgi:beta-phosphoglucomutase-like phosphatase (HAD superfamily)